MPKKKLTFRGITHEVTINEYDRVQIRNHTSWNCVILNETETRELRDFLDAHIKRTNRKAK